MGYGSPNPPHVWQPRPVLGLGLGIDFTFAWDNNNNDNDKNPYLNIFKGTLLGDKGQGVGIRDQGCPIWESF